MRIYTCTPVEFGGGPDFFARDSGLLCRGLQAIGIDSMAVMPGMPKPEDETDLIRTSFANLESAEWWGSLRIDGVVLYAWAMPKYRKVAAAIREAGVFLILNQDHGGLVSPRAGLLPWLEEQWIVAGQGRDVLAWARFGARALKGLSLGLLVSDPLRALHLKSGHAIACVSPRAAGYFRKMCRRLGGTPLEDRVMVIPHPVEGRFVYQGAPKRNRIACVGRWQDTCQKRPEWLMKVLEKLLAEDADVEVMIAGAPSPDMERWHDSLEKSMRSRVTLSGRLDRAQLVDLFGGSRIFYSPSAFESFGIAAGEALCCGCSVVAEQSVSMTAFDWFVSEESGRLASGAGLEAHVGALREELQAWEDGRRDDSRISRIWCERLHAEKVAGTVMRLVARGKR